VALGSRPAAWPRSRSVGGKRSFEFLLACNRNGALILAIMKMATAGCAGGRSETRPRAGRTAQRPDKYQQANLDKVRRRTGLRAL